MQVFEIKERQTLFVGETKGDVENPLLGLGQVHQARQEKRPHLGHGGANRMPLIAEQIPERDWEIFICVIVKADLGRALCKGFVQFEICASRIGKAGQVALHIRQEHRHPGLGKPFGENL